MAEYVEDPASRLNDLLDREEARIAAVFRAAIEELKGEIDLDELADLIEAGRLSEAMEQLDFAAQRLASAVNSAYVNAANDAAEFLSRAGVARIAFNQVNLNAVAAMQRNRLDLVREFTDEQRRATSAALIAGVEAGRNPIAAARNFRDAVGLTERQWGHVASYRAALERVGSGESGQMKAVDRALRDKRGDRQIIAAVKRGQRLPPDKIDWLVERYTARYIKHRAEVIGRTEALRSVHQGNEELYRQAIADGTLKAEDIERAWRTRIDNRERDTHRALNGQTRKWGEAWQTPNGALRYPGDPDAPAEEVIQCRCALQSRIRI